jgi:hypothetical protein
MAQAVDIKPSKPKEWISARIAIVAAIVLFVSGQAIFKFIRQPPHLDDLARESGNLNFMLEDECPQISHDGRHLLYCHSTENGVGVFFCDVASGKKKMLFEESEIHFGMGPHGVLAPFPWSPDDHWVVYASQGPGAENEEIALPRETMLTIGRGDAGEKTATLNAPFGRVVALEWLTSDAFVYVDGTEAHDFMLVRRSSSGNWEQSKLNAPVSGAVGSIDNHFCTLASLSDDTIAWLQANCLWSMNVFSGEAHKLYEFPQDRFATAFDYSRSRREFLFSCIESNADSLWEMPLDGSVEPDKIASDARTHDAQWNDVRWIADGNGYAFIRPPGLRASGLVIKNGATGSPKVLFAKTFVQYFLNAPDAKHLFVVGDIKNRPGSEIWEYNLGNGSDRCIVPGSDGPLSYLKHMPIRFSHAPLAPDEKPAAIIFSPLNADRVGNKATYPVVITSIRFVAEDPYLYQYSEVLANAGAYFVIINHVWSSEHLAQWAGIVGMAHDYMVRQPHVDKHRIFVLSNSDQALGLVSLFTNQPGQWRGAILLAPPNRNLPTPLQTVADRGHFKLLITTETRLGDVPALTAYQKDCASDGMSVDYIIHPETPHEFIAKRSQRDRIRAMLHFIFDDNG